MREDHITALRRPQWNSIRKARVVKHASVLAVSEAQLVTWPQVLVIQRRMVDYLNLIEEEAQ